MSRQWAIGIDAAWGGMGLCLATESGPIEMQHVVLGRRKYRFQALTEWCDAHIERMMLHVELNREIDDPPCVFAIEEPPMVYSSKNRGGGKGNQAQVCYSLGMLSGALAMYWIRARLRAELPLTTEPWLVNPAEWRAWWRIRGRGRAELKAAAIRAVQQHGWSRHIQGLDYDPEDGGPAGDAAEGILLAVGAARNAAKAPPWGAVKK